VTAPGRPCGESLHDLEATLPTEVDVNQCDVWPNLFGELERLGAGGCHPDDRDALTFQPAACGFLEARVVIDNQTAQHDLRIAQPVDAGLG
jgi:hypothetical protein